MSLFNRVFNLALEDDTSGTAGTEVEHTFYAQLTNQTQLDNAVSKEQQEQWTVFIPKTEAVPAEGSIRVRKSQYDGAEATYVLTTKIRKNDLGDKIETTMPITEDLFKTVKFLAAEGMVKDRFRFKVPESDLVWEIDMFPNGEGGYFEWCKIDLEVENRGGAVPELPISFDRVIFPKDLGEKTEDERAQDEATKAELYEKFFISKNAYLKAPETPAVNPDESGTPPDEAPAPTDETPAGAGDESADVPEGQIAVSEIPEVEEGDPNPNSADTGEPEKNTDE